MVLKNDRNGISHVQLLRTSLDSVHRETSLNCLFDRLIVWLFNTVYLTIYILYICIHMTYLRLLVRVWWIRLMSRGFASCALTTKLPGRPTHWSQLLWRFFLSLVFELLTIYRMIQAVSSKRNVCLVMLA